MLHGPERLIPLLWSVSGWNQSSYDIWVDNSWKGGPNTSKKEASWRDHSWKGEPNAPHDESLVDQSWLSNAPRTQASTQTNQFNSYFKEDNDHDAYEDGTYDGGTYNDGNEDNSYAAQSWSTPPPSYDSVRRPEPLRQPYYMEQYEHEIETVGELQHLGTFGMKPPYRFGTYKDDPLGKEYTKLDPQVLVIAASLIARQRRGHQFLSSRHATGVPKTNAIICELRDFVNIDSWRKTAPFPYETMRSTPDTSFHKSGTPGGAPSYQWCTKIQVACQNFRSALVDWQKCNEGLAWGFRNNLVETDLPNQIARLNRMHREICGIDDLLHVADDFDLLFKYRRFWTLRKMRRSAPSAFSILGLSRDLQKACQTNDWLFADRAPFLAYKVDLLPRRHQPRGLRGTTRLGYKRYGYASVRT